ncbi:MAG: hypothetical protein A2511_02770 [Deltaproteobacteria bacterium RIFOXYD12_FULL_50_9]|nr:MAG: hypothetical protein A2511_02770 [Deltaproteobacteria bacterium RIFOXYD12_FULL_50_9]
MKQNLITNTPPDSRARFNYLPKTVYIFLCIIGFTVIIYANTLNSPFTFDDFHNITDNQAIQLNRLGPVEIWRAAFQSANPTRPIANISFALNFYFHQFALPGYHVVNILIHALCSCLLYIFLRMTLNLPLLYGKHGSTSTDAVSFATAIIWTVHPLNTQSVTYIVQRMNALAALFVLLTLICYIQVRLSTNRHGRWAWLTATFISGCLALGSKENAATLPFIILLYELYFFQDLDWQWLKKQAQLALGFVAFFTVLGVIYLQGKPIVMLTETYAQRDFTLIQRLLTELRVVVYYLELFFFPHPSRLNLVHDVPLSISLTAPVTTLFSLVFIIGCLSWAIWKADKERLLSFCVLWYFGNLVIESSVIGLEIIFEHRTYLPSMLVSLLTVILITRYLKQKSWQIALLFIVVLLCSYWTYSRNQVWSDEVTLWTDCMQKSPGLVRPHENLGNALDDQGKRQEATVQYLAALKINPAADGVHYNLALALYRIGRLSEAKKHFTESLRLKPLNPDGVYYLAAIAEQDGNHQLAAQLYIEVLKLDPNYMNARYRLQILKQKGVFRK